MSHILLKAVLTLSMALSPIMFSQPATAATKIPKPQQRPIQKQFSKAETQTLDSYVTGTAGSKTMKRQWEKMKAKERACDDCGANQPFPSDVKN